MNDDHIAKTIATYNALAKDYAEKSGRYSPVRERDMFLSKLFTHAKILDAGCGPGRDSQYFSSKKLDVTGIDLSSEFIALAKQFAPKVTFSLMDLRNITFLDGSFDGIWACASLLHLKRDEVSEVLASFHRILKPGGVLFVSVKEGKGEKLVHGGILRNKPRFFTYYQPNVLRALLTDADFAVEDIYTWNQKDRWPARPNQVWVSSFSKKK